MGQAIFTQFYEIFMEIARKSLVDSVEATKDLMLYLKANPTLQEELLNVYNRCQSDLGIITRA